CYTENQPFRWRADPEMATMAPMVAICLGGWIMKISGIRLSLVTVSFLALLATPRAQAPAQGGGRGGAGGQDVQVKANQLANNFYALQANGLSTIGVLTGPDGVLMVDAGTAA